MRRGEVAGDQNLFVEFVVENDDFLTSLTSWLGRCLLGHFR